MTIKLVVCGFTLNVISAYAPQAGLGEEAEGYFWENMDEVVREEEGPLGHFSEYSGQDSEIDYRLYRKCDRVLCTDCKVILSKCLSAQHMLLVLDLEIKRKSKKREVYVQPKIKWAALTKDKAHELG
ncbi:uncharacterized protein LOC142168953 [Nicotiana tabacum]|uniref:Uncharacterized protein LOC142168953 n=1 Tax=Nicotiana tabacum TaxID=4097 RepID=A0AC58SMM1_TOBAC